MGKVQCRVSNFQWFHLKTHKWVRRNVRDESDQKHIKVYVTRLLENHGGLFVTMCWAYRCFMEAKKPCIVRSLFQAGIKYLVWWRVNRKPEIAENYRKRYVWGDEIQASLLQLRYIIQSVIILQNIVKLTSLLSILYHCIFEIVTLYWLQNESHIVFFLPCI